MQEQCPSPIEWREQPVQKEKRLEGERKRMQR